MSSSTTEGQLLHSVQELESLLRRDGLRGEEQRDLPTDTIDALKQHGFFRIWLPEAFGGLELDPVSALRVFGALAEVDASVAWVVSNAAVITTFLQVIPEAGLDEVFAQSDTIIAGAWFPPGRAVVADQDYQVNGQWAFGSASRHADWFTGMAALLDTDDQPVIGPNGEPSLLFVMMPASDIKVVDHWNTLGMRGTGSHDVSAIDALVPARRAYPVAPFVPSCEAFSGPLYKFHMWLGGAEIAAVALGVARAALRDFTTEAGTTTPSYTARSLAERPVVQDHVARAAAKIGAAEAYLHSTVGQAFDAFRQGAAFDPIALAPVQLAASHAVEAATDAIGLLHAISGTAGIRAERPLERQFRDVHTIAQHTLASGARFESAGQLLLGVQSDWLFFGL